MKADFRGFGTGGVSFLRPPFITYFPHISAGRGSITYLSSSRCDTTDMFPHCIQLLQHSSAFYLLG